jgi:hypothetical protein
VLVVVVEGIVSWREAILSSFQVNGLLTVVIVTERLRYVAEVILYWIDGQLIFAAVA